MDPLGACDPLGAGGGAPPSAPPSHAPPPQQPPPPASAGDPVTAFMACKVVAQTAVDEVPQTLAGCGLLAQAGLWERVLALVKVLLQAGSAVPPELRVQAILCRVQALFAMRRYTDAQTEFESLGDLDRPIYSCETHGELYQGRSGSFVPFALRVLHAELAARMKQHTLAMDRFHALLSHCEAALGEVGEAGNAAASWRRREEQVVAMMVTSAVALHDARTATSVLSQLLARRERDGVQEGRALCLSQLGRVHLQFGNLAAADDAFKLAEAFGGSEDADEAATKCNDGLYQLASGQYGAALQAFEATLELDPTCVTAANNKSICLLYCGRLAEATDFLEQTVRANPVVNLQHCVFNLSMQYDLSGEGGKKKKRTLHLLAEKYGSDAFDASKIR